MTKAEIARLDKAGRSTIDYKFTRKYNLYKKTIGGQPPIVYSDKMDIAY